MKTIIIELDEKFADIFTFTAIGMEGTTLNASTHAFDVSKAEKVIIGKDGKTIELKREGTK